MLGAAVSILLVASSVAGAQYVDRSPHTERWVTVSEGVRLHVLDWGGAGQPLLLVPGFGFNAHVYDDLAPELTRDFRVVAVTIQGWPPSDAPPSGYTYDNVAREIRAVLDTLAISRVVLVGHSFGGTVITRVAERFPERVRGLVYLDGALQGAARDSAFDRRPFMRPAPTSRPPDTTLAAAVATQAAYARQYFYGTWTPALEAELWAHYYGQADSAIARRDKLVQRFGKEDPVDAQQPDFTHVVQPALSICAMATPKTLYPWLTPDSARWVVAQAYADTVLRPFLRRECATFARQAPHGQTVMLDSGHYIFIDRHADVVRLIRSFVARLP